MLVHKGQKQERRNRRERKNISGLEGGTAGEGAGSLWEEVISLTSKTEAERGWLEELACSILGHLPSACLDHTE